MNKDWQIIEHSWSDTSIYDGDRCVCRLSIYDKATEKNQQVLEERMDAEARLIASAPELADTNEKLIRVVGEIIAAVRVNSLRDTFKEATPEQIDTWLQPWVDQLANLRKLS
jgi:hypothetical protein